MRMTADSSAMLESGMGIAWNANGDTSDRPRPGAVLPPDRRLDAEAAAAFSGRLGVFAWTAEVARTIATRFAPLPCYERCSGLAPDAGLPRQSASATRTTSSPARTSMRSVLPMAKPSCSSQRPRRRSDGTSWLLAG